MPAKTDSAWQLCPPKLARDEALVAEVVAVHEAILNGPLGQDPTLNLALPIESRALRRIEDWRVLLLLTPWMLARLLFPCRRQHGVLLQHIRHDQRPG